MQELEEQKQHLAADMLEAAGHIVLLPRVIGPAQKRLRKAFVSWFTESWLPSAKPFVLHKILLPLSPALKANSGNDELWVSFDSLWAALAMDNMLLPAKVVDDYDVLQPLLGGWDTHSRRGPGTRGAQRAHAFRVSVDQSCQVLKWSLSMH